MFWCFAVGVFVQSWDCLHQTLKADKKTGSEIWSGSCLIIWLRIGHRSNQLDCSPLCSICLPVLGRAAKSGAGYLSHTAVVVIIVAVILDSTRGCSQICEDFRVRAKFASIRQCICKLLRNARNCPHGPHPISPSQKYVHVCDIHFSKFKIKIMHWSHEGSRRELMAALISDLVDAATFCCCSWWLWCMEIRV